MTVVLLAHGSPDPRSGRAVHDAARAVAARTGAAVVPAFLDHDTPRLADVVAGLAGPVAVLPLLLSTAYHARVDVPAAVDLLDRDVTLLEPVGHPAEVLDDLLVRCAGPAVVVAAGTRVDEERAAFADAVAAGSRRTGVTAQAAFATGPGPRLQQTTRPGAATVVPWLLAPGRLLDSVRDAAGAHGCRVLGDGLLRGDAMLRVLAERVSRQDAVAAS